MLHEFTRQLNDAKRRGLQGDYFELEFTDGDHTWHFWNKGGRWEETPYKDPYIERMMKRRYKGTLKIRADYSKFER